MGQNVVKLPPGLESEKKEKNTNLKWKDPQKYSTNTHNLPDTKGYKRFK